jgi:hypothetical protein
MDRTPFADETAQWIWSDGGVWDPESPPDSPFQTAYFRRTFEVEDPDAAALTVAASADSRYVLFCNGEFVCRGPGTGDVEHQYYETADASAHLREGTNVLAAVAVSYAPAWPTPGTTGAPTARMSETNVFVCDAVLSEGERREELHTDADWRAAFDTAYGHAHREGTVSFVGMCEDLDGRAYPHGWRAPGYDDAGWSAATEVQRAVRRDGDDLHHELPHLLVERPVPQLEEDRHRFGVAHQTEGIDATHAEALLEGEGALEIPADSEARFVADAGALATGFPVLETAGGEGATVALEYAECFTVDGEQSPYHRPEAGAVEGIYDTYTAGGGHESYEPLHWRTFRYVEVRIETDAEPLTLRDLRYRFAAYPFEERAKFESSDPFHDEMWDVSWRTVRLCAHDTYEDCPYYEQLQYAGDTQAQILFSGYVSGDWRLAEQAVRQFDWSREHYGLPRSRYPSRAPQHIPSWALLWVVMVRDYWLHSGNAATARDVLDGVDACLDWFEAHADERGMPADLPYWKCVDWVPAWENGVPPGAEGGVSAIIGLQYAAALGAAAEVHGELGSADAASEYRARADRIRDFVNTECWDSERDLYLDRPDGEEASELGQAWALLGGAASGERADAAARALAEDWGDRAASWYGKFYVLRALSAADAYEHAPDVLAAWRERLDDSDLTTWPERPSLDRSFCHAWSSSPLYEFLAEVCGVKPAEPGFEAVRVEPHPLDLERAECTVPTPQGEVAVRWARDGADGDLTATVRTPEGIDGEIVLPGETVVIPAEETVTETGP